MYYITTVSNKKNAIPIVLKGFYMGINTQTT